MTPQNLVIEVNSNFHHLSGLNLLKKKNNRFREYRKKWANWPKNFTAGEFPLFIDIEATSCCNLKCPFCATTFRKDKINKGFMPFKTVKKIIDEGADNNLYGVKFNLRGEPLLHPDIDKFVKYAKQKGLIDIYFNTNAVLLDADMSVKLINAGLNRISISFDGYTKETYEQNRVGAVYENVLKNIHNMQTLKKRLGSSNPKIRIQTVLSNNIDKAYSIEYKKFWKDKVDEVGFLDYKNMKVKKKDIIYPWACPQIWQRMGIWWDGTILPCNHDDGRLLNLGNINECTIKSAWDSKKLKEIRNIHKKGLAHEIEGCNGCYLRDSEIEKAKNRSTV